MRIGGWASAWALLVGATLMMPLEASAREAEPDGSAEGAAPEERIEAEPAAEPEPAVEPELVETAEADPAVEPEPEESAEAVAPEESVEAEPIAAEQPGPEPAAPTTTGADFWGAPQKPPVYETWWFWTAIGIITLGVTLSIVIGVTTDHPRTTRSALILDHASEGVSLPLVLSMGW